MANQRSIYKSEVGRGQIMALYDKVLSRWPVPFCPSGICAPRLSFVLQAVLFSLLGERGRERMKRPIFRNAAVSEDATRFFMLVGRHFKYRLEAPPIFRDDEMRRATMPVLYLAGEHDAVLQSRKTAERVEGLLPNATVRLQVEDGHAAINMASEVLAFLAER